MLNRNFSLVEYWKNRFKDWQPMLSFCGKGKDDWHRWSNEAYEKLLELLGAFPDRVCLNAEVEYSVEDGNLIRERVVFDSEEFMSVPCIVLRPKNMPQDHKNAAIICSHGHGVSGKECVSGMRCNTAVIEAIEVMNYNYAQQMAEAGYLTISPDLRAFGERLDVRDIKADNDDSCNINFIKGVIGGIYTLTLNIWDIKCCIDYLETRNEVDPSRIGMMGLSQGGTMTTFASAVDRRIKAADIIGYVNPWYEFGIKDANFCGSQIVPDIYKYFDTHDIAGLIAPRPLLLEMGIYDDCFPLQYLLKGYEGVKRIYEAAGVADCLHTDIHPGPHAFAGNKAFAFFKKYL